MTFYLCRLDYCPDPDNYTVGNTVHDQIMVCIYIWAAWRDTHNLIFSAGWVHTYVPGEIGCVMFFCELTWLVDCRKSCQRILQPCWFSDRLVCQSREPNNSHTVWVSNLGLSSTNDGTLVTNRFLPHRKTRPVKLSRWFSLKTSVQVNMT